MRLVCALSIASILIAASARQISADESSPPAREIDFHKQVVPILANSCAKCHTGAEPKGGFSIETRESLLAGGDAGPAVVSGKSAESRLVALVSGLEPDTVMPAQGPRLPAAQIAVLRTWIDSGLPWEQGFTFKRQRTAPLGPRKVPLPEAAPGVTHPIDRLLARYFEKAGARPPALVDDRTFLRRAYLDLIGMLPETSDAERFLSDASPDKRARLVRELLANKREYAIHWLTFWNDALRNDYRGTGYIDGGRLQITDWLAQSLVENVPYDRFVRELISPTPASAGFIKGIVWRGVVNASQVPPVQAAQNISQVFLGINLKCASCHDSFINDWKLADAYGLAGIFAEGPLEMHRCDQPTGNFAPLKFLYPELGSIDAAAPTAERLRQLGDVLTSPDNGRFARTIVNRLWSRLLGRGLVEPVDDMDNLPWDEDILDYLASDLTEHGYDLKHTLELIATSQAYQLPAVLDAPSAGDRFVFRGPLVRRLTAEQFVDALTSVTNVEYTAAAANPKVLAELSSKKAAVRAALVNADSLLAALGRSNREQVVTDRPKSPTTLQALELTNGAPLADLIARGAKQLSSEKLDSAELAGRLYQRALTRTPTDAEQTIALELLGPKSSPESIEDLLWSLVMLPEFQLIY